ncbi:DNA oxidative demethylase ALKBH2-like [Uloborus diversus]|uniref:DNA oxidative demethylase ALKBH2-like n=1 Tax=Uloborus diversus TaxID=327109 RepID=UPI0024094642|nr:DNA oxidative demethylase ALKBH2-like [Uloborus diversus]
MHSINQYGLNLSIHDKFYTVEESDIIFEELLNTPFQEINVTVYGRSYTPKRKSYAFGDAGLNYEYSGTSNHAHPWTPTMLKMKQDVEDATGTTYNYALLNLYPSGSASIGMHRDFERTLNKNHPITTVSLGATRTLTFERNGYPSYHLQCHHGSLYQMISPTNQLYRHGIRPEHHVQGSRISITFRKIIVQAREDRLKPTDDVPQQSEMCALADPRPLMQHDPLQQLRPVNDVKPEDAPPLCVSSPTTADEPQQKRARLSSLSDTSDSS